MLAGPVTDLMTKSGRQPTPMRLPVPTLLSSMSSATALAGSTRAPSVYVPSEMGAGVPVREVVWHSFGASAFTLAVPMGTRAAELEVRNSPPGAAPAGAVPWLQSRTVAATESPCLKLVGPLTDATMRSGLGPTPKPTPPPPFLP